MIYIIESRRFDGGTWLPDFDQMRCQLQLLPDDCTALIGRRYDVRARTNPLAFALEDQQAAPKIRPGVVEECNSQKRQDLLLERVFIADLVQQKPSPRFCKQIQ